MYKFRAVLCFALLSTGAKAQDLEAHLIQIDLGREYGFFSKSPAVLRAVSVRQDKTQPNTAVLFLWAGLASFGFQKKLMRRALPKL